MVILKLDLDQWDVLTAILLAFIVWQLRPTPPARTAKVSHLDDSRRMVS